MPEPNIIYVISGCQRSFTSMMMQAVEAGGMKCVYDPACDQNGQTLHEMSVEQRRELFAEPHKFEGQCIKMLCHYGYLPLPKWDGAYKVILMVRDPEEILESYEKFYGKSMMYEDGEKKLPFTAELYSQILRSTINDAAERGDINFLILNGAVILAEPQRAFESIAEHWPIDAEKAAAIVDPSRRTVCHV